MPKTTLAQSNSNPLVVPVQHYLHHHHGGAAAAAAGAAAGTFLGAIAAQQEAQRQQGVQYCLQPYRSYDPESATYLGRDGFRHLCRNG